MEVAARMDVVQVRKRHPNLQIMGGIDKRVLAGGKKEIDKKLEAKIPFMLKKGVISPMQITRSPGCSFGGCCLLSEPA